MMKINIKKVAILGSGVMGSQIAAHFANARFSVVLFDLKTNDGINPNLIAANSLKHIQNLEPKPFASKRGISYIKLANYDDDLELLRDCDLIIEAIAELLPLKEQLFNKITPYIHKDAIIASNTSGLSITTLAGNLSADLAPNFCGIHFFNPPRYMQLVEIIPQHLTKNTIIITLEEFLVSFIGKTVIVAKDTPNFIANRLGVFSILSIFKRMEQFALPIEIVDELTGKNLGRAKSATFRTADVVGLDTLVHVIETLINNCKDDGFAAYYTVPAWLQQLVASKRLGAKSGVGIYRKDQDGIKVLDLKLNDYRIANQKAHPEVITILKNRDWAIKFKLLKQSEHVEAKFLLSCFADIFSYAAALLGTIADSPRDMDIALRAGFGWREGVFEIWQQMGFNEVALWLDQEKESVAHNLELPSWVFQLTDGIYAKNSHFDIQTKQFVKNELLPIYNKQLLPLLILNETPAFTTKTLYENEGVKLWCIDNDDIGILSFKSKMCTIGSAVLQGIASAIAFAEKECSAMVIWQEQDIFSAGANLEEFGMAIATRGPNAIAEILGLGHEVIAKQIRYSSIPIVAAVKGYALGGGAELLLHCDKVVASIESYIGLVEAGVGLVPAWGGTTEMCARAALASNSWEDLLRRFENVAKAKVATSAYEAIELGYLHDDVTVVMNSRELLYVAKEEAKCLANSNYRPPLNLPIKVLGEDGIATIKAGITNLLIASQISEYDSFVATCLATIMCGGEITSGTIVNRDWLLALETKYFTKLVLNPKTNDRINYMLKTGKPLRN